MYSALIIGFVFQSNSASSIPRSRNPGRTPCNFDIDKPKCLPRGCKSKFLRDLCLQERQLVSSPKQVANRVANS